MGARIHANLGNVLLIRRRMVLASNAHVIENEKAENSALMKMFHEVGIERACNWKWEYTDNKNTVYMMKIWTPTMRCAEN